MKNILRWATLAALVLNLVGRGDAAEWGRFDGPVRAEWIINPTDDGRSMRLLEEFRYTDPKGMPWVAPLGSVVDGASIPRIFWSVIGGPFEGKYREASVIHDVGCAQRRRPWKEVHRAFYNAMRCRGVPDGKAKMMYYAVYHFGPRWGIGASIDLLFFDAKEATQSDVETIKRWIDGTNPSLETIEQAKSQPTKLPTR
jgi:Protein of unknown function (DUF1353)